MLKKKVFFTFLLIFSIGVLFFNQGVLPLKDEQNIEFIDQRMRPDFIENEWLLKVDGVEEARQVALENGLILINISDYNIASFYGYENPLIKARYYKGSVTLQPKYLYYTQGVEVNDPEVTEQFALDHLDAYSAWQYSLGTGIVVAVIDTGIEAEHDEFDGQLFSLAYNSEHQLEGLEYVADDVGHGTAVSGVIAAKQNNAIGISGVAPEAKIMVIKANIDNEGMFATDAIADGIYYAVENGAHIINMSLGGAYYDQIMDEACAYAKSQGVILVAAAGNDGLPIQSFPAGYDSTISVGATNSNMERAYFSNFHRTVDISAPGESIYTTVMGNGYQYVSGTSFSSPYIAGVLALILSYYDYSENNMYLNHMYATAKDLGSIGKDSQFGHGLANAFDALTLNLRKVSFETFLGSAIDDYYVAEGRTFYIHQRPVLEGHYFTGWYKDVNLTQRWDFTIDVTYEDLILYAAYEQGESTFPDDYDILINNDDTVSILSYFGEGKEVIEVPNEIYGMPVVEIGGGAFIFNDNIQKIIVPDTVKRIHSFAFAYMPILTEVVIGSGLEYLGEAVFAFDESLVSVAIGGESLEEIKKHTFYVCTSLESAIIPNTVKVIEEHSFEHTFNLVNFTFPTELIQIRYRAFSNSGFTEIHLPANLKSIHSEAFAFSSNVTSISLGAAIDNIGEGVFVGLRNVEEFIIDSNNQHFIIDDDMLYSSDLTTLYWYLPYRDAETFVMPENILSIKEAAFANAKFKYFEFNNQLTYIPFQSFYEAENLKSIVIPYTISLMGESVFKRAYALERIVFPDDLRTIPNNTCDRCISLKEVVFPKNLRVIGSTAFIASGLEKVILPETVDEIKELAFAGCISLEKIYLPDGLRTLGMYAVQAKDTNIPSDLISVGHNGFPVGVRKEMIFPMSTEYVDTIYIHDFYEDLRRIDFGGAEDVFFVAYNGSRLEEVVLNAQTKTARVEGHSLNEIHLYVHGIDTEISLLSTDNYVIHAHVNSYAHQFAIDNGIEFIDLNRDVVMNNITVNIDGFASVVGGMPLEIQNQELLHFKLDVLSGFMVYEVLVNGKFIANEGREYFIRVHEDIVIDITIKPNDYILEYDKLLIENQIITKIETNAERVNLPDTDELGNPILGFPEGTFQLAIELLDMYNKINYPPYLASIDVKHISIPGSIKHLPFIALNFRNLESIELNEGIETMAGFEDLGKLKYIVLPESLTVFPHWIDENGFVRGAFDYCGGLEYIVFKSALITEIPDYAFYYAAKLKQVYFESDIQSIGKFAFYNTVKLESIVLNNALVNIDSTAFKFMDYIYYIMGISPFVDQTFKLANLKLISNGGNAIDYALEYSISHLVGLNHYVAYMNDDSSFVYIEIVGDSQDALFMGEPSNIPINDLLMYGFSSWDVALTNILNNTVTNALYTQQTRLYEVRFIDSYTKELIGVDYVEYGGFANPPNDVLRDNNSKYSYEFVEWNSDFSNVTKDMIVEAVYQRTLRTYSVTFYDWDNQVLDIQTVGYGQSANSPFLPPKDFHVFESWSEDITYIMGDIDVYPIRQAFRYEVVFYDFYGSWVESKDVYDGEAVTPPVLDEVNGYVFIGWSEDLSEVRKSMSVYPIYAQAVSDLIKISEPFELAGVKKIATGPLYSMILDQNNRLYATGSGQNGNLAFVDRSESNYFVDITDSFTLEEDEVIIDMFMGYNLSIVLTNQNRVFAFGQNSYGQLGIGEVTYGSNMPTDISSNFGLVENEVIISVSIGEAHVLALTSENRVFSWGNNDSGQLGTGDTDLRTLPIDITSHLGLGLGEEVIFIDTGDAYSAVLTNLGNVYIWGANWSGQLGNNSNDSSLLPILLNDLISLEVNETIKHLALGNNTNFIITSEERIFAWGSNYYFQTTVWDHNNVLIPTEVTHNFSLDEDETISEIKIGSLAAKALTSNGRILSWGFNHSGQMGQGFRSWYNGPTDITENFKLDNDEIVSFVVDREHTLVLTSNGDVYGFGLNLDGQLGNFSTKECLSPTLIIYGLDFTITQYNYGDEVILETVLEQIGYEFVGWYYDYHYRFEVKDDFLLIRDTVIYAYWNPMILTVRFFDEDGTLLKEELVPYGSQATPPIDPLKAANQQYTFTFSGWDKEFDEILDNLDVYATYSFVLNEYTVRFFDEDGTLLKEELVAYGSHASAPTDPTKEATAQHTFTFSGWDKEFDEILDNLDVYATYSFVVNEYIVRFLDEDGTLLKEELVAYGSSAFAPIDPTKEATAQHTFTFSGWDKEFDEILDNLDVYATYSFVVNEYTVRFLDEDGTLLKEEIVLYGQDATPPTDPSKQDTAEFTFSFSGWEPTYLAITGNLDVYAVYISIVNQYLIRFLDEDGSLIKEEVALYGSTVTAPTNPEKPNDELYSYVFVSWSGSFDFVTENLDLYPIYQAVALNYIYRLSPGIDTVVKDSFWIDEGLDVLDEMIIYQVNGVVDTSEIGVYTITYIVMKNDEVIDELIRIVRVIEKEEEITITLNPGVSTLRVGDTFVDAGATASVGEVFTLGTVDTSKAGVYLIEYQVINNEVIYKKYRFVIVYNDGIDLTSINAIISNLNKEEDEE